MSNVSASLCIVIIFTIFFSEMSPEFAAEAFYNGEIEQELQRIGLDGYRFKKNSDREACFEKIKEVRRTSVYMHTHCSKDCQERGTCTVVIILFTKLDFP